MIADSKHFDDVSAAVRRKPFVPFAIVLSSGKRYEILDWREIALARGNPHVVVLVDGGRSHDFFNWGEVAAIEIPCSKA